MLYCFRYEWRQELTTGVFGANSYIAAFSEFSCLRKKVDRGSRANPLTSNPRVFLYNDEIKSRTSSVH